MRTKKRAGDGPLQWGAWNLWKHQDTHGSAYWFPVGSDHGAADGAEHHFMAVLHVAERVRLYPDPQVRRRRGSLTWLLGKVQLRTDEANYTQSF